MGCLYLVSCFLFSCSLPLSFSIHNLIEEKNLNGKKGENKKRTERDQGRRHRRRIIKPTNDSPSAAAIGWDYNYLSISICVFPVFLSSASFPSLSFLKPSTTRERKGSGETQAKYRTSRYSSSSSLPCAVRYPATLPFG